MKPPATDIAKKRRISAPSHHRKPAKIDLAIAAVPEPPASLSEAARTEWARIVPPLILLGAHPVLDRAMLAVYCKAVVAFDALPADADPDRLRQLGDAVARYSTVLGLTPRSRKVLGVQVDATAEPETAAEPDPASRFFSDTPRGYFT